ncbi:Hcy-binding domain-containing protein [Mycena venus]|uniref:Hcy-binding domain-containing protein n=1 Tax=Mycena venus TaxID=2733690 RepID=A0A8H6YFU0_9AGAR|nr:Hcy-binding domain-containing protein [Mycena venus]
MLCCPFSLAIMSDAFLLPLYPSSVSTVKILDGGLGTTLENSLDITHTPLWSAKAAIEHPDVVLDAHLAFLRAGARIILTSTYQCSSSTFDKAGYTAEDARGIMSQCVRLAVEARSCFAAEQRRSTNGVVPDVKIALSLGPFGAGLSPAQEFDGYYPPPFGPRGYTSGGGNCNAFAEDDEGRQQEEEAMAALARFHFERLCVFADDEAAWDALDFIAFETVPLLREIRAIRMAMADLEKKSIKRKPWWISFVFPEGKFPETKGDGRVSVRSVVVAALRNPAPTAAARSDQLPIPSALGINCTEMDVIPGILSDMEDAVLAESQPEGRRPWLILYPNGGDVYDPISQTWVVKNTEGVWAEKLCDIVVRIQSNSERRRIWPGGGCRGLLPNRSPGYRAIEYTASRINTFSRTKSSVGS